MRKTKTKETPPVKVKVATKKETGRKRKPLLTTDRKSVDNLPYWFYTDSDFVKCEKIAERKMFREVRILEGDKKGQEIKTHQTDTTGLGVFPRLFQQESKPLCWKFYHRLVLIHDEPTSLALIPKLDESYYFNREFTTSLIDGVYHNDRILLTGHKGVGKTSIVEQMASRINQPVIRINMNGETRISDFLGKITLLKDKTFYQYGVLPTAMKNGWWLICDEIDMAEPNILSLLYPVLEKNGKLVLKENEGEVIVPHPNFRIFGTSNSIGIMQDFAQNYIGGNDQNDAFLDRWTVLYHEDHPDELYGQILKNKVGINRTQIKRILAFKQSINQDNAFAGQTILTMRSVLDFAVKLKFYKNPLKAANMAFLNKFRSDDREVMLNILTAHFPIKNK
jgi:MoxR-like ATPase